MTHGRGPRPSPANDIGDLIISDNKIGVGVSSNLSTLTVRAKNSFNLTGTVSKTASSPTLTGTGTLFQSELGTGDRITVPGGADETLTVIAIASDTSLTVDSNFAQTAADQIAVGLPSAARFDDASGNTQVVVRDDGSVGVGTMLPNAQLEVLGNGSGDVGGCPVLIRAHAPQTSDAWPLVLSSDAGATCGVAFWTAVLGGSVVNGPAMTFSIFQDDTMLAIDHVSIDAYGLHLQQAGFSSVPTAVTADYTVALADHYIEANAGDNGITITLPAVLGGWGRELYIHKVSGAGDVTIVPAAGDSINGSASKTISTTYSGLSLIAMTPGWVATVLTAA